MPIVCTHTMGNGSCGVINTLILLAVNGHFYQISRKCKRYGAALVVDATQCVGAMPLDFTALGADFVACSVHKWLLGLYSFAFLYARDKYHKGTVLEHHDRNRVGSDDWDYGTPVTLDGFPTEFTPGASRFDMGGRPNGRIEIELYDIPWCMLTRGLFIL